MGSLSTSLDGLLNGSTYVGSSPLVPPFSNPKLANAGDFYDEEHLHFYMHYTKGGSVAYIISFVWSGFKGITPTLYTQFGYIGTSLNVESLYSKENPGANELAAIARPRGVSM